MPDAMTGRSLLPLLTNPRREDARRDRDFVVFGRDRHTPAQAMPSLDRYPARAIRTGRWLLVRNLAPERWPAGVPAGATQPMGAFADCDDGPTKRWLVAGRDEQSMREAYRLCILPRPQFELYDCQAEPDQVRKLADRPGHRATRDELSARLDGALRDAADPRVVADAAPFYGLPYRGGYLQRRIDAWRAKQGDGADPASGRRR